MKLAAFKTEQLKKELIHKGELQGFEKVLGEIVDRVCGTPKCRLACCDICDYSVNNQSIETGSFIQIGFKTQYSHPLHVIWAIFHEYGHHLSGMPTDSDNKLERENLAWDYAFKELQSYPELIEHSANFLGYKYFCLQTYINSQAIS